MTDPKTEPSAEKLDEPQRVPAWVPDLSDFSHDGASRGDDYDPNHDGRKWLIV